MREKSMAKALAESYAFGRRRRKLVLKDLFGAQIGPEEPLKRL
ncbi:MAG: hypothetical protein AVDCRST_MAG93-4764 [uncultured Chloroflexia bacterium]|uniref:Uncharacterized protein n=1 Tax=uncultured Chloroflexia bacterium TaxID=1672391 RepID=A0A6J4KFR3_9CHLR|nr:MAG: hypothetical protein AVDCRST_MAG93-4764 [uncultured Chloroflexia bacterium]